MGKGVCSRRQRKIFQSFLLITVICGSMYAFMISYEMHKQLKKTEAMAQKYQQHQESLSAQLQVVYEHRSRLEKSLQKERMEHKKAKDDHLVYKLESEHLLNKEKESTNRFNALQAQHQMLKSQHEDLKKQYYEMQEQHQNQGENHERVLDEHREQIDHLQRTKEVEISRLKENVYNLKEENRQLRKAHQDIRTQLLDVRQQHKDLRTSNDQLQLTVEDHRSALAVAELHVQELHRLKGQTLSATQAVPHSPREGPPHVQSLGLGAPETKPSPHTQPGHTTTQAHTPMASYKEKVEPEVSHHVIPDVVRVESDNKQTVEPKQVQMVPEEAKEHKVLENREKTSFQHWRSRLEHTVLDGDPGRKRLHSHEENQRKEGLSRLKRQPEILNPDIVLVDLHPHHKDRDEVGDIHMPANDLKDEVLNPAEDPNNQGEDEFEEAEQKQLDEPVPPEQAARRPTGSQERVAQEEQLVMAGSPDQQEDNLDDQYEEAEEDQAGDDMVEDKQEREEDVPNEEDPYSEENTEQGPWIEDTQDTHEDRDHNKEEEEEDYKGEVDIVEENEGPKEIHTNRRAEM
ncbi:Golgi integral membrane protein 4b isoform X2 [Clupea harengus]|uniref:Golgi integral membrane protein 4b isoform X2 n=1 Tax=Clupea harengus TaxID=7950 RepID=A0A6P8EIC1_CLUHA|nr:Golgi integral membrane protein 4b isoform X2 [Clupea harengus]